MITPSLRRQRPEVRILSGAPAFQAKALPAPADPCENAQEHARPNRERAYNPGTGSARNARRREEAERRRSEATRLNAVGNLGGLHGNYGHRPKSAVVAAAIAAGAISYIGSDCRLAHGGRRYVSTNDCIECGRLKNLYRRRANAESNSRAATAWAQANPDKRRVISKAHSAARRARKLGATPSWLTQEQHAEMKRFWADCPPGMTVDHMVPLKSDKVCGLHVPWNLQYLSPSDNFKKSNRFWENDWSDQ